MLTGQVKVAIISKLANDSHNVAQKLLESSNSNVDSDNEESSSVEEVNNQSNENVKKSSNSWFNLFSNENKNSSKYDE